MWVIPANIYCVQDEHRKEALFNIKLVLQAELEALLHRHRTHRHSAHWTQGRMSPDPHPQELGSSTRSLHREGALCVLPLLSLFLELTHVQMWELTYFQKHSPIIAPQASSDS